MKDTNPPLHLYDKVIWMPIKRVYFDMINEGIKKEEYREIKDFWTSRLFERILDGYVTEGGEIKTKMVLRPVTDFQTCGLMLHAGYGKDKPHLLVDLLSVWPGVGNPQWGAPDFRVYINSLGEIRWRNWPAKVAHLGSRKHPAT